MSDIESKQRYDSEDDFNDSEDEQDRVFIQKKIKGDDRFKEFQNQEEDAELEEEEDAELEEEEDVDDELADEGSVQDVILEEDGNIIPVKRIRGLKKLSPEKLEQEQKRIKKTGVCYLSRIPPYMKPAKLRSVLSRFGKIDRLFLKPEDPTSYHKRKKYGGNKKKMFTEGWVEFVKKSEAKICASALNANVLGGKKTSYYHDDVINIKYLSGFKWFDLTQQIAKENEVRQAKLALEISQQLKLNKSFIHNVEQSKHIERKRKREETERAENPETATTEKNNEKDDEIRRSFKQRMVTSTRADAADSLKEKSKPNQKLNSVLLRVF